MRRILILATALSALSGAALAQPAYNSDEGGPPSSYPACTHAHEDRCVQGGHRMHMGRHHHHWRRHHHSSTDGERG